MLHHLSIAVTDPGRVARVLAELMNGHFFEFPIYPGAYIALADDTHGTAVEILPQNAMWLPGDAEAEVQPSPINPHYHAVHAALSVPTSRETIEHIGAREGWLVRYCDRGPFQLMEFWIENTLLVELMPQDLVVNYQSFMRSEAYVAFLNATPVA